MKPSNWDGMSQEEKQGMARDLLGSMRGQFIVSQALVHAIELMGQSKYPERSNIEDMEILLELFPLFAHVVQATKGI